MQRNASAPGSKSHTEIQKAIEEENAKREAALLATRDRSEASTREDAETRWELSFVRKASQAPVRVVTVGYGELAGGEYGDDEEEEEEKKEKGTGGRMKFGRYGVRVDVCSLSPFLALRGCRRAGWKCANDLVTEYSQKACSRDF